ncbi:NADPH-dependent FMN reductase [Winogradskyella sp. KYW1333]|uniref:NADPH-dependent FMN reductase n=1 Tax=Winogradskyella sp. KYW1333 TaxID=2282123 RepID=UPI000DF4B638|nr:NAD(P)H-dependent oxidoreductase [Winogradskyella sp. KYW1333]RCT54301.1 NADPH-dependent oxidoreductase [Winogradskyella sp. KYW1333]
MKKIIALAGSNSSTSINEQLATYASSLVDNVKVKVLDLNDFEMPIYSSDRENESGHPNEAVAFVDEIRGADGIIISLAEYNGAYSGAFKNIFDWASRVEQKTFLGKPMLLMASSPGGRGGASVLEMASERFPRHDANIVGKFSLPSFYDNFKDGKIINEDLNNDLLEEVNQFQESL